MIWMFPALNNLYHEDKYLFCSSLGQYGTNILLLCKISQCIKNLDILCCKIIEFFGGEKILKFEKENLKVPKNYQTSIHGSSR